MSLSDSDRLVASVIVPTHARPERLARLLDSLVELTVRVERFEIIVVDDGSPPRRRPSLEQLPANARLLTRVRGGPASARNAGAATARGRLVVFVDDDCVVSPDWLTRLLVAHAAYPEALLGGSTRNGLTENLCSDVAESLLGFLEADERRAGRPLSFLASNNMACARERFRHLGGFDDRYSLAAGEDRAFCRAWRASGGELRRIEGADVLHFHAHDLQTFWRQQHNYGRGAALFHEQTSFEKPLVARERTFGLPRSPAFYRRLLTHYARRRDRTIFRRILACPLVALSQCAVACGLLSERRARRRR